MKRLVIIGNGMASARLVEHLLHITAQRFQITVFGAEPCASYNRIMLSPVLGGEKSFTEILLPAVAPEHGICYRLGEPVHHIDRERRCVVSAGGETGYDHLVIATGARPMMPPWPGVHLAGVVGFRTLDDVDVMLAAVRANAPVVVIGGGLLGIEAAAALRQQGASVTLVHRSSILMDRQLDETASALLVTTLQTRGIQCLLSAEVAALQGNRRVEQVQLTDGRCLSAGLVVVATGVTPECELARNSGVPCARGILVDGQLRTQDSHISALGECCELRGETFGLVAPCLAQAQVLAQRLAGQPAEDYRSEMLATRLKVTGIAVVSAGELTPQTDDEVHTLFDPLTPRYRQLIFRAGRLRGALLFGDAGDSAHLLSVMKEEAALEPTPLLFGLSSTAVEAVPQSVRSRMMSKPVLIVVGHGMVSHHFLEQLVERGLHQQYHITVFGEERYPAYDRVHLSEYFSGRSADDLSMVQTGFFERHGIELRTQCAVTAIDRQRRCVVDAQGRETPYDQLVLATGSYPFVPPLAGSDRLGCLVYRTLDDLDAIADCAAQSHSGVVIGGGLLGLEAANALRQLGLETHVVEFAPRLMAVQLDDGGAAMLRRKIEALGVQVHTGKATQAIVDGTAARHRLCFADGSELESDLVLFSAGIRPRDQLARDAGLEIGARGGIVIDDAGQTSDANIYAIGECACWQQQVFGLVAPGYQMARSVAATLAGQNQPFTGADMGTKLKLLGVEGAGIRDAHGKTARVKSIRAWWCRRMASACWGRCWSVTAATTARCCK